MNALTTTHAAPPGMILGTWATVYGMPALVTASGFPCVASTYMYLNHVDGPVGSYTQYWRDIAPNVSNRSLMLGGGASSTSTTTSTSAQPARALFSSLRFSSPPRSETRHGSATGAVCHTFEPHVF